MNFTRKFLFGSSIIVSLLILVGCQKNVPGPKGEQGEPGKKGNLKMTIIEDKPQFWTPISKGWKSQGILSQITENVITDGEVEVYMKIGGQWWKLPHAEGNLITQVKVQEGLLHYYHSRIHDEDPPMPQGLTFRIIISEPLM